MVSNMNYTETELAYLAGFIDGEGCIGIYNSKANLRIFCLIRICNTNLDVLDHLTDILTRVCNKRPVFSIDNRNKYKNLKKLGFVTINRKKSLQILVDCLMPYMVVKKKHLKLLGEFLSEEDDYKKLEMHLRMKFLNS
jgi:hypothetical protein